MKIPRIPNPSGVIAAGKALLYSHRTELLLGASLASTASAVVLGAKGGYNAHVKLTDQFLEEEMSAALKISIDEMSTRDKVDLTWQCYLPAGVATVSAMTLTTSLHMVHVRDKRALAQAAIGAVMKAREDGAFDSLGILTEEDVNAVHEKRSDNAGQAEGVAIGSYRQGQDGLIENMYLIRDARTGRDIWSSVVRTERAINELALAMLENGDAELGYFYTQAGFSDVPEDNEIGWSGNPPTLHWEPAQREDGQPVMAFSFRPAPSTRYNSTH